MRVVRHWIGLALLAPMLILAVSASTFVGMRCRMSGLVSTDACGAEGAPAPPAPVQSSVGEPGCCDRVVVELAKPIGNFTPDVDHVVVAPIMTVADVLHADGAPSSRGARVIAEGDPPRRSRRPLCLLNRSLLI